MRNVSTAVIGRPYGCISIYPHEEIVIMESLLQYPEKTIAEMVEHVYSETGSKYAWSTLRAVASSIIGRADIHIFVFCTINFF